MGFTLDNQVIFSISVGLAWYIYLILVGGFFLRNGNDLGLSLALESDEHIWPGFREKLTSTTKLSRALFHITMLYESIQLISVCFATEIPWPSNSFSNGLYWINFIGENEWLSAFFWILFAFQLLYNVVFTIGSIIPWIKTRYKTWPTQLGVNREEKLIEQDQPMYVLLKENFIKIGGQIFLEMLLLPTFRVAFELSHCTKSFLAGDVYYITRHQSVICWRSTHWIHISVAILMLFGVLSTALVHASQQSRMDFHYLVYPRFKVALVVLKAIVAGLPTISQNRWIIAVVYFISMSIICLYTVKVQPYLGEKQNLNHWQTSVFSVGIWTGFCSLITSVINNSENTIPFIIYCTLILLFILCGYYVSKYWASYIFKRRMNMLSYLNAKSNEYLLNKVVEFVLRISLLENSRSQIFKGGKLKHFVKVLLLSRNYNIRNTALQALGNLVLDVDICTYMTTHNEKIDLIIAVGVKAQTDHEKNNIARLLANVSINEPNRRVIMKSKGMALMLLYLDSFNVELRRQALRCIKNLSYLDDAKFSLVELDALNRLISLNRSSHSIISRKAFEILGLLICNEFCREIMLETGTLKYVLSLIGNSTMPHTHLSILQAIGVLASISNHHGNSKTSTLLLSSLTNAIDIVNVLDIKSISSKELMKVENNINKITLQNTNKTSKQEELHLTLSTNIDGISDSTIHLPKEDEKDYNISKESLLINQYSINNEYIKKSLKSKTLPPLPKATSTTQTTFSKFIFNSNKIAPSLN